MIVIHFDTVEEKSQKDHSNMWRDLKTKAGFFFFFPTLNATSYRTYVFPGWFALITTHCGSFPPSKLLIQWCRWLRQAISRLEENVNSNLFKLNFRYGYGLP